jgi:ketosteroid isomerase-like protein
MFQADVELVQKAYAAFRRNDNASVMQLLDDQVEIYQPPPMPWGGRFTGHAGAQQYFGKMARAIDTVVEADQFLDSGDRLVALVHTRGVARATGAPFDVAAVHHFTIRDGKITHFEAFIDNPPMLKALGQE